MIAVEASIKDSDPMIDPMIGHRKRKAAGIAV